MLQILADTPTETQPLERQMRRREDNIRIKIEKIGVITKNWVDLPQDMDYWRFLVNDALNLRGS